MNISRHNFFSDVERSEQSAFRSFPKVIDEAGQKNCKQSVKGQNQKQLDLERDFALFEIRPRNW